MHLFVYGSLMRGETHAGELDGARFLDEARTVAAYTLVDLGPYPALLGGGTTVVRGELYEVGRATLDRLDAFEEHPEVYRRTPVALADGRPAEAYLLVRPASGAPPILGGDWRTR